MPQLDIYPCGAFFHAVCGRDMKALEETKTEYVTLFGDDISCRKYRMTCGTFTHPVHLPMRSADY